MTPSSKWLTLLAIVVGCGLQGPLSVVVAPSSLSSSPSVAWLGPSGPATRRLQEKRAAGPISPAADDGAGVAVEHAT
jgi:hypothetical protein